MTVSKMITSHLHRLLRINFSVTSLSYWKWLRLAILLVVDAIITSVSYYAAFVLRLDDFAITSYQEAFKTTCLIYLFVHLVTFMFGGMYRQVWRYANFKSGTVIVKLLSIAGILTYATLYTQILTAIFIPRSIPAIAMSLALMLHIGVKFSWRGILYLRHSLLKSQKTKCFIYGAGTSGELLSRQMLSSQSFSYEPVGFLDDDPRKAGRVLNGLKIFEPSKDLENLIKKYQAEVILIALHAAPGSVIRSVVNLCRKVGVKPLIVPDLAKSFNEDFFKPRPVDIKDLLKRSPKSINKDRVNQFFKHKTVLVTGAGGSIGSELARQINEAMPYHLILLDASEFNLYTIDQELRQKMLCKVTTVMGNVTDEQLIEGIFADYKPDCILHAAAYKHVHLVESNPISAVKNNVLGTKVLADAAIKHGSKYFTLISTDKAVEPTNIMGMTKRACEILLLSYQSIYHSQCIFSAVRFGNVLGSSGSVIPKFLAQIQAGGPVTVTDKRVTRYFMLISEAVGLVLQTMVKSKGGEIFVLDMGEPVNIYEMAKELITLSGKKPFEDIDIVITGLVAGEKLYEELIIQGAEKHELEEDIFITKPESFSSHDALYLIKELLDAAAHHDEIKTKYLAQIIGTSEFYNYLKTGHFYTEQPFIVQAV